MAEHSRFVPRPPRCCTAGWGASALLWAVPAGLGGRNGGVAVWWPWRTRCWWHCKALGTRHKSCPKASRLCPTNAACHGSLRDVRRGYLWLQPMEVLPLRSGGEGPPAHVQVGSTKRAIYFRIRLSPICP